MQRSHGNPSVSSRMVETSAQVFQGTRRLGRRSGRGVGEFVYERLATVVIQHGYFKSRGGVCSSFSIQPTPSTSRCLRALGLRVQPVLGGFSILYNVQRKEALLSSLWRERTELGAWLRLSFVLTVEGNPHFINGTDVPLNLCPATHNFYFTNRQAHDDGDRILLQPGKSVTTQNLASVVPVRHRVQILPRVQEVWVVDVAGRVVFKRKARGNEYIEINFARLPKGMYRLLQVRRGEPEQESNVLFTAASPIPLAFIDLFFSRPTPAVPGIFPINLESGKVNPWTYVLVFGPRAAIWVYAVVPPGGRHPTGLEIRSRDSHIMFNGPTRTHLANGRLAYEFLSRRPLELFDHSPFRLELWEQAFPMSRQLVRRLPVASAANVRPRDGPCEAASRILVRL